MFGDGIFGDVIFADLNALTVVPPTPVVTLAGDGDMIPFEYLTDDEEVLLMTAALIR